MNPLRETCHCGHHKDTHFESAGACLGMRCDDCLSYRDDARPDPKTLVPRKPNHPAKWRPRAGRYEDCGCYDCKRYAAWVAR